MIYARLRGYIAHRILSQLGFENVRNVKGRFTRAREMVPGRVESPKA
jgi:hypothetical protein